MSISSLGVGSGLDIAGLVRGLVDAERQPVAQRLDRQEARAQASVSAFGSMKSVLSAFQTALRPLMSSATLAAATASLSKPDIAQATATSVAQTADYDLNVLQRARAQRLASSAFAEVTSTVGTGTLTFSFGTHDVEGAAFTPNADKASVSVVIGAGDNSLQGIRDAVNRADIGVRASLVDDGEGMRLVFSVQDSGEKHSLKIDASDAQGIALTDPTVGLGRLAYDPLDTAASGMSQTVSARDALFEVDGISMRRASNSVTGALPGVSLTLLEEGETRVSVKRDRAATVKLIEGFVASYNDMMTTFNGLSAYNAETGQAGILLGDSTLRTVQEQMRRVMGGMLAPADSPLRALAEIGIVTRSDGTLELNSGRLDKALNDHPDAVARLFATTGTGTDSLVGYVGASSKTQEGSYAVEVTQLATRGSYTGLAANSFNIGAGNDTLKLTVDGRQSGSIKLTHGGYDDGAAMAAELQAQINADSALRTGGSAVTVSFEAGAFVIRSERYGSASKVAVTSATGMATTLGIRADGGTSTAGVDVAGTIGGIAATGAGQVLTGAGQADGLRLRIEGGLLGARGEVAFSRGVADRLVTLTENYTRFDGMLATRTDSAAERIDSIGKQREALAARMEQLEARYLAQFSAMDALVAQMQSTGSFLTQQLDQLANMQRSTRR